MTPLSCLIAAALAFAQDGSVEAALAAFKKAYRNPDAAQRAEAVALLGKCEDARVIKILGPLTSGDDPAVRLKAVEALGGRRQEKPQAAALLLGALGANSKEPKVLIAILDALGRLGERSAAAEVNRRLEHPVNEVSVAAIRTAGRLASGSAVERLLAMWDSIESFRNQPPSTGGSGGLGASRGDRRVRYDMQDPVLREALTAITGQAFENSQEGKAWWAANRGKFRAP